MLVDCAWREVLASAKDPECHEYARVFHHQAMRATEANDPCAALYRLLADVTSLVLDPRDHGNPLRPYLRLSDGSRSWAIEDLTADQAESLGLIADATDDSELRARISDVLWTLKRSEYQRGQVAARAYVASARKLRQGELT